MLGVMSSPNSSDTIRQAATMQTVVVISQRGKRLLRLLVVLGVAAVRLAAVAVVVAVMIAVVAAGGDGAVEQHAHVLILLALIVAFDDGQHLALHESGTDHEDGGVGMLGNDAGVGHHLDGRTVEDDEVVLLAQLVEHLLQALAEQQFGGVGRYGAHGDDLQMVVALDGTADVAPVVHLAVQVVGYAQLGTADVFGQ